MRCLVLLLLCASALSAVDERALRLRVQQAERRGDWVRAVTEYEALFALQPQDVGVARGMARALGAAGMHARAIKHLQAWLEGHGDDAMAYLLLGDAQHQAGQPEKAVQTWRRLLEMNPSDVSSYQQVSDRCQAIGQTGPAIEVLMEGRRVLGDDALFSWELAALSLQTGQYERALEFFFSSIAQSPNRLSVVEHQLGPLCQRDGGALLEALLGSTADDPLVKVRLVSTCALFAGQPARGLEQISALSARSEGVDLLLQYASQCEARGFAQVAVDAYGEYARLSSDTPHVFRALLKRAQISARGADKTKALEHYAELAARFPNRPEAMEALVGIARLQLEAGRSAEAVAAGLLPVIESPVRGSWLLEALDLMAESALRMGDMTTAAAYARQLAQQGQSAAYRAGVRSAELAYFRGDCAAVIDDILALTDEGVDDPLANDALDLLLVCEEYKNESMLPELVQAQLLDRQGLFAKAAVHWDRVIDRATPRLREWALLKRAGATSARDLQEALRYYEALVKAFPDGRHAVEAQLARADLLQRAGRLDEALRVCEAALLAAPADALAPELRLRIRRLRSELSNENS